MKKQLNQTEADGIALDILGCPTDLAAALKVLDDANSEWEKACESDSGDEASDDWLSAAASELNQARSKVSSLKS